MTCLWINCFNGKYNTHKRKKMSCPCSFCLLSGFVPCQSVVELVTVPRRTVIVLTHILILHNYKQAQKQQGIASQVSKSPSMEKQHTGNSTLLVSHTQRIEGRTECQLRAAREAKSRARPSKDGTLPKVPMMACNCSITFPLVRSSPNWACTDCLGTLLRAFSGFVVAAPLAQ